MTFYNSFVTLLQNLMYIIKKREKGEGSERKRVCAAAQQKGRPRMEDAPFGSMNRL